MGRDQHDDRKRALALGKFKFLYQVYIAPRLKWCLSGKQRREIVCLKDKGGGVSRDHEDKSTTDKWPSFSWSWWPIVDWSPVEEEAVNKKLESQMSRLQD